LINSVKHYFPNAELDYDNILSTYAGIRPLVMQKGKSESEISRKHIIFFSNDGLLTITGGKLTAFRSMSEDLFKEIEVKKIFPNIRRQENFSKQKYIISLDKQEWFKILKNSGIQLEEDIADHIYQQYGKGALKILEIIRDSESLKEKILKDNDFIKAEIIYCLRYEMTQHLIDLFCRRTEMFLWISHKNAIKVATIVADIMATEYNWNEDKKKQEINAYIEYVKKTVSFL
ncbi:unnamed protein product, partial [marine sediment metagenome]